MSVLATCVMFADMDTCASMMLPVQLLATGCRLAPRVCRTLASSLISLQSALAIACCLPERFLRDYVSAACSAQAPVLEVARLHVIMSWIWRCFPCCSGQLASVMWRLVLRRESFAVADNFLRRPSRGYRFETANAPVCQWMASKGPLQVKQGSHA